MNELPIANYNSLYTDIMHAYMYMDYIYVHRATQKVYIQIFVGRIVHEYSVGEDLRSPC